MCSNENVESAILSFGREGERTDRDWPRTGATRILQIIKECRVKVNSSNEKRRGGRRKRERAG